MPARLRSPHVRRDVLVYAAILALSLVAGALGGLGMHAAFAVMR